MAGEIRRAEASPGHAEPGRARPTISLPALVILLALLMLFLVGCRTYVRRTNLAEEYHDLGNAFYEVEAYERAAEYYRKALELEPDLAPASFNLARAYIEAEAYDEAIRILEDLRGEDAQNVLVLEALAYAHSRQRRFQTAVSLYEEVLERSPYRVSALYNAGVMHRRLGNKARAREALQRAYVRERNDASVLYHYGMSLYEDEAYEKAVSVLLDYTDAASVEEESRRMLEVARILSEQQYIARALKLYDRFLAGDAENETALFERAALRLTETEEVEAGIEDLRNALEAGFSDTERAAELLGREELLASRRVEDLLSEYGLLGADEAAEDTENGSE
ncbi:MAG: tetratricopeptide repeat protein [Spirochaetaceae bacterium]